MSKTKYRVKIREWLNEDETMHGRILVSVEDSRKKHKQALKRKDGYSPGCDMQFSIGDCNRQISLDFWVDGKHPEQNERHLEKIKKIEKAVKEFRKAFEKEKKLAEKLEPQYEANRKANAKKRKDK